MKIAIVVQRYGIQINGGAELHARQLAEHLDQQHDVEIITTKAESYLTWDNAINTDTEYVNNIKVHRFASGEKNNKLQHYYYRKLRNRSKIPIFLRKLGLNKLANSAIFDFKNYFAKWQQYQGPYCPELPKFIEAHQDDYDIFIFFTYLYYPTNSGLPIVAQKSLLIPTAHNEKPFFFNGFKYLFKQAKFIMYNSHSEKKLVEKTYPVAQKTKNDIAGVGIDPPVFTIGDRPVKEKYFVYIGRIDHAKNIPELVQMFNQYSENKDVKLILIGKNDHVKDISGKNIIATGFISEQEKNNWLYHSEALIIPSKFESLSMVTLEAMKMGIPVIANKNAEVLNDHIIQSQAGLAYDTYEDFEMALDNILQLTDKQRETMGINGKKYVENYYQWDKIMKKFDKAFKYIKQTNR